MFPYFVVYPTSIWAKLPASLWPLCMSALSDEAGPDAEATQLRRRGFRAQMGRVASGRVCDVWAMQVIGSWVCRAYVFFCRAGGVWGSLVGVV